MKYKKKSVFRQMYDALPTERPQAPKTAWVNEIAAVAKVHPTTVGVGLLEHRSQTN